MRNLFVFLCLLVQLQNVAAQSTRERFNFQGVARDAAGKTLANTTVSLRLSIHALPTPIVYQETHQTLTSNAGIFTISIGGGQTIVGTFPEIKWEKGNYFLQVEIDPLGGTDYIDLGLTPLAGVPYANHASQADRWKNNDAIIQEGEVGFGELLPPVGEGARLIWYPRKYAFLAGFNDGNLWQDANIGEGSASFGLSSISKGKYALSSGSFSTASGESSFALGKTVQAKGSYSVAHGDGSISNGEASFAMGFKSRTDGKFANAFGKESVASGEASFAAGINAKSDGHFSVSHGSFTRSYGHTSFASGNEAEAHGTSATAMGYKTNAIGDASISLGEGNYAKAFASTTIGSYNLVDFPNGPTAALASDNDRIFQIGNGLSANDRSNAMTVLRNGKVGIGYNVTAPEFMLDVDSRMRIRHYGSSTAGIFFNNSSNQPDGFIGMMDNNHVGIFNGGQWNLWVANDGVTHVRVSLFQHSDRRLKRNFSSLTNSLSKINKISGYNYYLKETDTDQTLQTGVIAQEIEAIFPELVRTDKNGTKSVNYMGFIPHLIESVKSLKEENDRLRKSVERLDILEASVQKLVENNNNLLNQASK